MYSDVHLIQYSNVYYDLHAFQIESRKQIVSRSLQYVFNKKKLNCSLFSFDQTWSFNVLYTLFFVQEEMKILTVDVIFHFFCFIIAPTHVNIEVSYNDYDFVRMKVAQFFCNHIHYAGQNCRWRYIDIHYCNMQSFDCYSCYKHLYILLFKMHMFWYWYMFFD